MALKHVINGVNNFFAVGKLRKALMYDRYKHTLDNETLNSNVPGVTDERHCDNEIVVSLTSYGKRLPTVYLAVASIMHQTLKANRIVLWLGNELKDCRLPSTLRLLQKRGLEIRFCEDLGPHTKLLPSLKAFPDASIITIDDDVMYDMTLIDRLVNAHIQEPHTVWGNRLSTIILDNRGGISPYKKWKTAKPLEESPLNFATGVGGVLYPPHVFTDEIFDRDKFMRLAPTADDLWFKAMEIAAGVKVKRIVPCNSSGDDHIGGIVPFREGLAAENVINGRNDKTVATLHEYFDLLHQQVEM